MFKKNKVVGNMTKILPDLKKFFLTEMLQNILERLSIGHSHISANGDYILLAGRRNCAFKQ